MEQIYNKIDNIIKLLNNDTSNVIAIVSVVIAVLALVVTIIFNIVTHKQYIKSLDPQLTFKFYSKENDLYLAVKNTGKSVAKDINIKFNSIYNNGEENTFYTYTLYGTKFMLFPEESVQGPIAASEENICTEIFPVINVDVTYIKTNTNKQEKYNRDISLSKEPTLRNYSLQQITECLESIMYSENRMANYFEGRTLHTFDKINVEAKSSLKKDLETLLKEPKTPTNTN